MSATQLHAAARRLPAPVLKIARPIACALEWLIGGSRLREALLLRALGFHYGSRYRRDWGFRAEPPHFYNHRLGIFSFAFGQGIGGPYPYSRAFHAADLLRLGDRLLDIGCGDGFFTARFFAERCASIEGIDIEPSAIAAARRDNPHPRVHYRVMDAVAQPFPSPPYEVVVWDGAVGHFAAETTNRVLEKVRAALTPDGVFVGSESLGREGYDHLQFFETTADLRRLLVPYFRVVQLRTVTYRIGRKGQGLRTEAFWRCSNARGRLDAACWLETNVESVLGSEAEGSR